VADRRLFTLVSILITISIVLVYSLSEYVVLLHKVHWYHFLIRQLIFGVFSIIVMFMVSRIKLEHFNILGGSIFIISSALIAAMPFMPESFVHAVGGAKRWIKLFGFSIAPVEFFKVGFIWFLAWSFSRKIEHKEGIDLKEEFIRFLPYGLVFVVVMFMIAFIQNDLGQVMVLGLSMIIMLMFAGSSGRFFMTMFFGIIISAVLFIVTKTHRIERIKSWWALAQDTILSAVFPDSIAQKLRVPVDVIPYQIGHSLNAIHHGGIFGVGLGNGGFKLGFLSDVHTDFILAGATEEFGFIGLAIIVFIFISMILRIFKIANRLEDKTLSLFVLGVGLMLSFSFIINSYGISGLTPIKGIAVPFLSYGGSQILSASIAIGMVLIASKKVDLEKKV